MEAYVHGVPTRSVDDLVKALGADSGISKSEVSRICGELDEELVTFKERPLDHTVPLRLPGRTLPTPRPPPRQEEGPGRGRPVAAGGDLAPAVRPDTEFHDLGSDFYDARMDPERRKRNHLRRLEALGSTVTLEPAT
jgi:hypothetical protein